MAVTTVEALLSALPLFEKVPEESLQRLEASMVAVTVPAREYVSRTGEAATELYACPPVGSKSWRRMETPFCVRSAPVRPPDG